MESGKRWVPGQMGLSQFACAHPWHCVQQLLMVLAAACHPPCRCRPGTYREAEGGDGTECTPCQPGEDGGAAVWGACPAAWHAAAVASASSSNAAHHAADTRLPLPHLTHSGYFAAGEGSANCTACPAGSISEEEGATACTSW